MGNYTRRKFLKSVVSSGSGVIILGAGSQWLTSCNTSGRTGAGVKVFIPMPLQVVIDDVGWWSGEDSSLNQGPYRTGINRNHVPADYQAIADLGRELGIRPQAAFIACEWDKENILKQLPTATWMGREWDNSKWIGPWMEEAADIIRQNRQHMEITIHGVGHEYWEGGIPTRAEWTDSNGQMRPRDQVELHLEYFGKILDQHDLGPLPKSFVPAAFRHCFGPSDGRQVSLAEILKKWGVNYINTPFSSIYHRERIQYEYFGFDSGVMTVDRGDDEFPWLVFPADPSSRKNGPTCGLHWPNMLNPSPERNRESMLKWVNYLKPYNEKPEMMLAPDSEAFQLQLMHHSLTGIQFLRNSIELDFAETDKWPNHSGKNLFTLKFQTDKPCRFTARDIDIKSQLLQEGTEYLYVLNLERRAGASRARIHFS